LQYKVEPDGKRKAPMTASRGIRIRRGTRSAWVAAHQGQFICQCGCEQPITLRPEHYPDAPKYIHGHNSRITHAKPKAPRVACQCGCGEMANHGKRFVSGHNGLGTKRSAETRRKLSEAKVGSRNPQFGKRAPNYKGTRRHHAGYLFRCVRGHPFGRGPNSNVMEHRLAMERHLRDTDPTSPFLVKVEGELYLRPELEVHHRNEVKDDNRLGNLQVLTKAEHARLHVERLNAVA
jgi:hypothetical protein